MEETYDILFAEFKDKGFTSEDAHKLACSLVEHLNKLGSNKTVEEVRLILYATIDALKVFEVAFNLSHKLLPR